MIHRRQDWVKLPTAWIERHQLTAFRWGRGDGSTNIAALMLLLVISHHVERETGIAELSYDDLCGYTGLSRVIVSKGLTRLVDRKLIERVPTVRGQYRLVGYEEKSGWSQLPAKALYAGDRLRAFEGFYLRRKAELDALKLYLLFASRRNTGLNMAIIGYEKIEEYSGVTRNDIKTAQSYLAGIGSIHIEHVPSKDNPYGYVNGYRLVHLDPRRHMGTTMRSDPALATAPEALQPIDLRDLGD